MNDKLLTTSEVAGYCQVTNDGVVKWIKAKKLRAYSTPGGHYRIRKSDFKEFLERYGMPIDPGFFAEERKKILVVDNEANVLDLIQQSLGGEASEFRIVTAKDGYEAGLKIGTFKPDLVIVDLRATNMDAMEVCKRIKHDPNTESIKVVAVSDRPAPGQPDEAVRLGADACLTKPLHTENLKKEVARLLESMQ